MSLVECLWFLGFWFQLSGYKNQLTVDCYSFASKNTVYSIQYTSVFCLLSQYSLLNTQYYFTPYFQKLFLG